jgi:hypothetical protein
MDFHRKSVQDCRENWIAGKPKTAGEEVAKNNYFSISGSRSLLIQGGVPGARRKESGSLVFSDHVGCDFRFFEN